MDAAKNTEASTEDFEEESTGPCIGQRHWIVLMICWLICGIFCMRDILGVAIVAMVNNTAVTVSPKTSKNLSGCPGTSINRTSDVRFTDGSFSWSRDLQGMILGSLFWGYIVLQVPGGALSQRFGAKWILGASTLANVLLTALSPLSASISPYLLITCRVVEGLFQGVTFSASQAMLSRWVPPNEASFLINLAYTGGSIGAVLGLVLAGFLCRSSWGWQSSFYVAAGIGAASFVPWALFATNSPEQNRWISAEELTYISRHLGSGSQENCNRLGVPWRRIITDTAVWANIVSNFSCVWIYNIMISCVPQFLSDIHHIDISQNGILTALPWVVNFFFTIVTGYVSDLLVAKSHLRPIIARKSIVFLGCVSTALCLFGVVFTACNETVSISLLMLLLGFNGVAMVPFAGNISEISPEFSGVVMGIVTAAAAIAGFVTPQLTDHLTSRGTREEWNSVFFIGAGIALFGAVFYVLFASSTRREWQSVSVNREIAINCDREDSQN